MPSKQRTSALIANGILDAAAEIIIVVDEQQRVVLFNRAAESIFGYRADEVMDQPLDFLLPAQSVKSHQKNIRDFSTAPETFRRISGRRAMIGRRKNGEEFPTEAGIAKVKLNGKKLFVAVLADVTERLQAEKELQNSRNYFQALIENSTDGIVTYDREGKILYTSPGVAKITGVTPAEVKGQSIFHGLHREDRERGKDIFNQSLQNPGVSFRFEVRVRHKDGAYRWVEGIGRNLLNEPSVGAIISNYHDITERKRAEETLRAKEEQARLVLENVDEIVYQVKFAGGDSMAGALQFVSARVENILGYAPEELVQARELWMSAIHPDDLPFLQAQTEKIFSRKEPATRVYRIRHKQTGEWHWMEDRVVPELDDAGRVVGQFGVARDVTERMRVEGALRQLSSAIEQTADHVFITDRNGVIEYCNTAFEKSSGYAKEEVLGKTPRIVKSGKQRAEFYENLWQKILAGQVFRAEFINQKKNGELYYEEKTITPIRDAQGNITHFVSTGRDVTERKRAEEEIQRRLNELQAVNSISSALRAARNLEEMRPIILDATVRAVGARAGSFFVFDPDKQELALVAEMGYPIVVKELRLRLGQGVAGESAQKSEPIIVEDVESDARIVRPDAFVGLHKAIALPLKGAEGLVGALFICFAERGAPSPTEMRILNTLADMAGNALHRAELHEQTERRLEHLDALRTVDNAINHILDLKTTLNVLLDQVTSQLRVDAADILSLDPSTQLLQTIAQRGFRTDAITRTRDINQAANLFVRAALLAEEKFISHYAIPLVAKGEVKGVLEIFQRALLAANQEWIEFAQALANQAAIAIDNAALFQGLQRSNDELSLAYETTIEGWSHALDLRDKETEGHTQRVTAQTLRLARALGVSDDELANIRRGALLHDIGKMGVPDSILLKPGPLTDEEWKLMRQHPVYAFELLATIPYLKRALDIPYCHHEKWDGTGYPRGLRGEEIPFAARIFAIVDVWDALRSDRPYRKGWSEEKVIQHIQANSGTHFDPRVAETFLRMISDSLAR
ncbi:MAG: PAS domain S-box protein [Chloroflexi bacterium]|nr:PAS domain S-box protein [Chloroflexota bacterium]